MTEGGKEGGRAGKKTEHLSGIFLTHLEANIAYIGVSSPLLQSKEFGTRV